MGKSFASIVAIVILLASVFVVPTASSDSTFETYVVATIGSPDTLDPAIDYETAGQEVIQNVYETLVWYDGSSASQLRPMLATEVPTQDNGGISPDGLTYTLHLRSGVKFHNGETMTSEDVVYSLKRVLMINDPNSPAWMLGQTLIPDYYRYDGTDPFPSYIPEENCSKAIWAPGADTVQLNLTAPYPGFLSMLANPVCSVVSKSFVEGNGGIVLGEHNAWMVEHCCGTGPYWLESMELNNYINLRSHSEYWDGPASIERVSIKTVNDEGTRLMMLQSGDVDSIYLPASKEAQVSSDPNVRVVKGQPSFQIELLGLNQQIDMAYNPGAGSDTIPADFFSNREVRLAFAYAYDEQRFIDEYLAGNGVTMNGIIPQGMAFHDPTVPTYQNDLALAASYLNSASTGQNDTWGERGFSITLAFNQGNVFREAQCTIMKENLESLSDLGLVQGEIGVTVLALDWPNYLDAQRYHGLPIFFLGWAPDYADPDDYVSPFIDQNGTYAQRCGLANATLTDICRAAAREGDPFLRAAYYNEMTAAVHENAYYIWSGQHCNFHVERTWTEGYYYNPMLGGIYFSALSFSLPVPGQVTGLDGKVGSGKVALFWDNAIVAESYAVYRSESPGGTKDLIGTVSEPYFLDDTVVDGTSYYYNVSAINSVGVGPSSAEVALTPGSTSQVLPLRIDSDAELLALKWLYDWSGTGNMNGVFDPIMIQDLQGERIEGMDSIYIANTTLGINIWNCSFNGSGVRVVDAKFVNVMMSAFNASSVGIEGSENCTVQNCSFEAGSVFVESSTACTVNTNTFLNSTSALFCIDADNSDFWYNHIESVANVTLGDYLTAFLDCDDNRIMGNQISGGRTTNWGFGSPSYGMMLRGERNQLDYNAFQGCSLVLMPGDGVDLGSNVVMGENYVNGGQLRFYSNYAFGSAISGTMGQLILVNVPDAVLRGVVISNCSFAVQVVDCDGIIVEDCYLNDSIAGLALYGCSYGTIDRVEASGCLAGLLMQSDTSWVTVTGSSFHHCHYGVFAGSTDICTLIYNNVSDNDIGLEMSNCEGFLVHFNLFGNNTGLGVNLGSDAAGNQIYMNRFIGNNGSNDTYDAARAQAYDDDYDSSYPNLWYGSLAQTTVGNLWSDWTGPDENLDGFVDQPYPLAGSATDPYPLAYLVGPPGPPINIVADTGESSVVLTWSPPLNFELVGVDGYNVYRWNGSAGWELIATVWETTYIDSGLSVGLEYIYQVSAFNPYGIGPGSENATATPYTVPGAPSGVQGSMSGGVASLSWEAPGSDGGSAIDYYVVYKNGVEAQTVYAGTYAEITGLSMGVTYIFTVRAHNAAGLSEESAGLTLIERTVPSAPVLKAEWGDDQVELTWSTPYNGGSPVTGYKLYKQWPGLSNWTELAQLTGNSYSDQTVQNGQTYAYKVRATNSIGEGKMSNVVRGSPLTLPSAPEVYILNPGDHRLYAAWAAPDDDGGSAVIDYIVYLDGVQYATVAGLDLNITGLTNGIAYSVTVKARTAAGIGPVSGPMTATPVGLPGAPSDLVATVEPNSITLSWQAAGETGGAGPVQYRVYVTYPDGSPVLLITTSITSYVMPMDLNDVGLTRVYKVQSFNAQGIGGNATTQAVEPLVLYVSGMVVDENGERKPGVMVKSQDGGQTMTDTEGLFALQVEPGSVTLTFESTGYSKTLRQVEVGEEPVDIGVVSIPPSQTDEPQTGFDPLWIVGILGVVVIALGAVLFLRRKR